MDDKVSPSTLAAILGYTAPLLYQEAARGVIPTNFTDYTYKEIIHNYVKYFKKAQDVKLEKVKAEQESYKARKGIIRGDGSDSSQEMNELALAKMKSDVRLNVAKEAQVWLKTYVERQQYISIESLIEIAEPVILNMKSIILSISEKNPLMEEKVDLLFDNLHTLGKMLVDSAEHDGNKFLDTIMQQEIDYSKLEIDYKGEGLL
jgi:hypothetical protein